LKNKKSVPEQGQKKICYATLIGPFHVQTYAPDVTVGPRQRLLSEYFGLPSKVHSLSVRYGFAPTNHSLKTPKQLLLFLKGFTFYKFYHIKKKLSTGFTFLFR